MFINRENLEDVLRSDFHKEMMLYKIENKCDICKKKKYSIIHIIKPVSELIEENLLVLNLDNEYFDAREIDLIRKHMSNGVFRENIDVLCKECLIKMIEQLKKGDNIEQHNSN